MPVPEKKVRVFISSTFKDMHAERDHLVTVVFRNCVSVVRDSGWSSSVASGASRQKSHHLVLPPARICGRFPRFHVNRIHPNQPFR